MIQEICKSEWTKEDQEWADKEAREYALWAKAQEQDSKEVAAWLRRMKKTHKRCANCTDGVDGEPDGFGGFIGGTCRECQGSGWVLKNKP